MYRVRSLRWQPIRSESLLWLSDKMTRIAFLANAEESGRIECWGRLTCDKHESRTVTDCRLIVHRIFQPSKVWVATSATRAQAIDAFEKGESDVLNWLPAVVFIAWARGEGRIAVQVGFVNIERGRRRCGEMYRGLLTVHWGTCRKWALLLASIQNVLLESLAWNFSLENCSISTTKIPHRDFLTMQDFSSRCGAPKRKR